MRIKVVRSLLVLVSTLLLADSTSSNIDWRKLIPAIRESLNKDSHARADQRGIGIFREADITGDGIPEALVTTGDGGAYTSDITLMRIENGKPVLARFKDRDGKVSSVDFAEGSSVMHGVTVEMMPEKHALYSGHWDMDSTGKRLSDCFVDAYQWNGSAKTFDYNSTLSTELKDRFCRKMTKELTAQ
jgi:hypothetical protein